MNIIEKMATANRSYQRGVDFDPKGIVLHSIGVGQPSADRMATAYNVYQPNGQTVCVHAFLEPEKVVQIAPWTKTLGHVGGNANYTHIGVEMCEPSQIKYTGGATFTCSDYKAAQEYATGCYNTAVELFAYLCKEYSIDPIKGIISHSEAYKMGIGSNHGDPEHLWRGLYLPYTMDGFRKAVKDKMEEKKMEFKTFTLEGAFDEGLVGLVCDGKFATSADFISAISSGEKVIVNAHDQSRQVVFDDEPPKYKIFEGYALIAIKAEKGHYYPVSIFVYNTKTSALDEYDGRVENGIWKEFKNLPMGEKKMAKFKDIENSGFKSDIEWAASLGIANGYADGTFKPNEPCTRGQMCAFLHRLYDALKGDK